MRKTIIHFYTSILESLANLAIWLAPDLFALFFCFKSHLYLSQWEWDSKTKQPIVWRNLITLTWHWRASKWEVNSFSGSLFDKLATGSIFQTTSNRRDGTLKLDKTYLVTSTSNPICAKETIWNLRKISNICCLLLVTNSTRPSPPLKNSGLIVPRGTFSVPKRTQVIHHSFFVLVCLITWRIRVTVKWPRKATVYARMRPIASHSLCCSYEYAGKTVFEHNVIL